MNTATGHDMTPIRYGSQEYEKEVQRIMDMEAYGVNTAGAWNRLNERVIHRRPVSRPLLGFIITTIAIVVIALVLT